MIIVVTTTSLYSRRPDAIIRYDIRLLVFVVNEGSMCNIHARCRRSHCGLWRYCSNYFP